MNDQSPFPAANEKMPIKIDAMPPEIAAAVVQVMAKFSGQVLGHDAENKFDDYDYTSVDGFLRATNPACAEAGLIIKPIQVAAEKEVVESNGKTYNVMTFKYHFLLAHKSGVTWYCPYDEHTIRLLWKGAQTSGMAQSYVLKQYMRALFQIATGDKDADADEKIIDEAPREIARQNAARKNAGKSQTSKFVNLTFGAAVGPVGIDEVETRVAEYLAGVDKGLRAKWRAANAAGLERLHALDKALWLRIGRIIEDGISL